MPGWASAARAGGWPPVVLRIVVGIGFIVHGWAKLSRGPDGFAQLLGQVGVPFPGPSAWTVTMLELFGGVAILAGAFVTAISVALIVSMIGAIVTVHFRYGFSSVNTIGLTPDGPLFSPPGYELNLLYIAALVTLIIGGPGKYSLDPTLRPGRRPVR